MRGEKSENSRSRLPRFGTTPRTRGKGFMDSGFVAGLLSFHSTCFVSWVHYITSADSSPYAADRTCAMPRRSRPAGCVVFLLLVLGPTLLVVAVQPAVDCFFHHRGDDVGDHCTRPNVRRHRSCSSMASAAACSARSIARAAAIIGSKSSTSPLKSPAIAAWVRARERAIISWVTRRYP